MTTRLVDGFKVDDAGIILSPGKFEAEHVDVLYWYEQYVDSDEFVSYGDGASAGILDVLPDDRGATFWLRAGSTGVPADAVAVLVQESSTGFVTHEYLNELDAKHARKELDRDMAEQEGVRP